VIIVAEVRAVVEARDWSFVACVVWLPDDPPSKWYTGRGSDRVAPALQVGRSILQL